MKTQLYKTGMSILVAATVSLAVNAEELNVGSRVPTQEEIINHLRPQAPVNGATSRTRGIKLMSQPEAAQPQVMQPSEGGQAQQEMAAAGQQQAAVQQPAEPVSISMEILFDFNSAQLSNAAVEQLHPLGQALQSPDLNGLRFVLEGHTDATGSEDYNLVLSQHRAMAVKQHLAENYGIDPQTLDTIGRGENLLLDPNEPSSGINRRVRIVSQN
jgi:outer membrane protein OmpA-like peptidoglycan-associated protein